MQKPSPLTESHIPSSHTVTVRVAGRVYTLDQPNHVPKARDKYHACTPCATSIPLDPTRNPAPPHHDVEPRMAAVQETAATVHSLRTPVSGGTRLSQWIDHVLHPTEALREAASQTRPDDKPTRSWTARLKEAFTWGTVFGLLLGCLCVVITHGLSAGQDRIQTANITTQPREQAISRAPVSSPPLIIPAIRLYGLYWRAKAHQGSWHLLRVAAYSADLTTYESMKPVAVPVKWRMAPISWNVAHVQTLPSTSPGTTTRLSAWIANEVSALTALVGAVVDHAPAQDAWTAYRTANRSLPQTSYFRASGKDAVLRGIQQRVEAAFIDCAHSDTTKAASDLTSAVEELQKLEAQ